MWRRRTRRFLPKQVDGKASQADPIHPVFQAVLVQSRDWVTTFAGERCHPLKVLQPLLDLACEDRPSPFNRHPEGLLQPRRMVGTHRRLAGEHPGSPAPACSLRAGTQVGFRLLGTDAGARQRKAGDDGVGGAAACTDTAQDMKRLPVVVLPVGRVAFQCPDGLTGRTGRGAEQNNKIAADFLEIVDVPPNVDYDNRCVFEGGTRNALGKRLSSRFLFLRFLLG